MVTEDDVDAIATAFPDVTVGARWGNKTWFVGKKGFAWMRPLSKADIARLGDTPVPKGAILAVACADLLEKDAALASNPKAFFTIQHFDGYAAFLIQLEKLTKKQLKEALTDAWSTAMRAQPAKKAAPKKTRARSAR